MKIAIIGAGMAGLTAGKHLSDRHDVTVFDKSRGISGRMSTRYADAYEFDHGAQYFTAKDSQFLTAVTEGIAAGHVAPWPAQALYQTFDGWTKDSGGKRYVGTPRMNSWLKAIGADLNVRTGVRIVSLVKGSKWELTSDAGEKFPGFDQIILAIPAPQAEVLLPSDFTHLEAVKSAKLDACFALMLGFPTPLDLDWDSLRVKDSPIDWIANNSSKPGRNTDVTCLMIHASAAWSEAHQDDERADVQATLVKALYSATGLNAAHADHVALHRWLYASVAISPDQPCLHDPALGLSVAGDWCAGGRVEGAFLSGLAAAQTLFQQ